MMMILLIAAAFALDPSTYQSVLQQHVDAQGRVDYAALKASPALSTYIAALSTAEEPKQPAERMAFWINAYNALTVDMVVDHYPLDSIKELDGGDPWTARMFQVAGRSVTLNHIEHQILRPMGDPRIHAAISCASRGCPPLQRQVFTGATLQSQLEQASRAWMASNGISVDPETNTVMLNRIFEWYGADFAEHDSTADVDIPGVSGTQEAALHFAMQHLPQHSAFLRQGGYTVSYAPYDWGLNAQ